MDEEKRYLCPVCASKDHRPATKEEAKKLNIPEPEETSKASDGKFCYEHVWFCEHCGGFYSECDFIEEKLATWK